MKNLDNELEYLEQVSKKIHTAQINLNKCIRSYTATITKSVGLSQKSFHQRIQPSTDNDLHLTLFDFVNITISCKNRYNHIEVVYRAEIVENDVIVLPSSCIDTNGIIDGTINVVDAQKVYAHYLKKIMPVYEMINAKLLNPQR
jgi:formate hydrogenlyase regulatory protein HycA